MSRIIDELYEVVRAPVEPGNPHYTENCTPDLRYHALTDINPEDIALLGVRHVVVGVVGTLMATNKGPLTRDPTAPEMLQQLAAHRKLRSLSLGTDNMANPQYLLDLVGLTGIYTVFQPRNTGNWLTNKGTRDFWSRLLTQLDCTHRPHKVAMIGSSPYNDIRMASSNGLKTVLVDRLAYQPSPTALEKFAARLGMPRLM